MEWIWIYPRISTQKSMDMDMDMDGKFHIHCKPGHFVSVGMDPLSLSVVEIFGPQFCSSATVIRAQMMSTWITRRPVLYYRIYNLLSFQSAHVDCIKIV